MDKHERIVEVISIILLILVGLSGIGVFILDFIGVDFINGPWRWLKGPLPVMLLTVAILALALGLERYVRLRQTNRRWENIESLLTQGPESIIRALNGVNIELFSDAQGMYVYVIKKMREAKSRIDDLTWGDIEREKTPAAEEAFRRYVDTISTICSSKKKLAYREVMSFSSDDRLNHFDRAKDMLAKALPGYRLRYYDLTPENLPPLLVMMIIDTDEVILASWGASSHHLERGIQLAIRHPDIVKFFQDYYDAIWHAAKPLSNKNFEEIRKQLGK